MAKSEYVELLNQLNSKVNMLNRTEKDLLTYFLETLKKTTENNNIINKFSDDIHSVIVSQTVLATELNTNRQNILSATNELIGNQFIAVAKSGQANVYVILPHIAFKSVKEKGHNLTLRSKLVLAKSENEDSEILKDKYTYANAVTILNESENKAFFALYNKFKT